MDNLNIDLEYDLFLLKTKLGHISKQLEEIDCKDMQLNKTMQNKIYNILYDLEKSTIFSRNIPFILPTNNTIQKEIYSNVLIDSINIDCKYIENDWFYVKIPRILPKKKKRKNADFLKESLNVALNKYFINNELKKFQNNAVFIIKHNYDRNKKQNCFRDNDNIEIKMVIDTISCFTLIDDNAKCCQHYYCSDISDNDNTEIYIVPKNDFVLWLEKFGGLCEN